MPESNTAATGSAKTSSARNDKMPEITEPYLREQLEVRRAELNIVIQEGASSGPCQELLHEVDAAIERMENGSFGICEVCHDPVEKERLLADPLARLCLDHLSSDEQRALERDLELAARVQRRLLPQSNVQFRDWQIRLHYKPAGLVSGDYCDLIVPEEEDGKLVFLLGDVSGKGV